MTIQDQLPRAGSARMPGSSLEFCISSFLNYDYFIHMKGSSLEFCMSPFLSYGYFINI